MIFFKILDEPKVFFFFFFFFFFFVSSPALQKRQENFETCWSKILKPTRASYNSQTKYSWFRQKAPRTYVYSIQISTRTCNNLQKDTKGTKILPGQIPTPRSVRASTQSNQSRSLMPALHFGSPLKAHSEDAGQADHCVAKHNMYFQYVSLTYKWFPAVCGRHNL